MDQDVLIVIPLKSKDTNHTSEVWHLESCLNLKRANSLSLMIISNLTFLTSPTPSLETFLTRS